MGLFGRKKTLTERFPTERIGWLNTVVALGMTTAARAKGVEPKSILMSRFFAGYLLGYPGYVDDVDERLGAGIRAMLFASQYGEAESDDAHRVAMQFLAASDAQVRWGMFTGSADGTTFFQALEAGRDAHGATSRLETELQGERVDLTQQISN